MSSFSSALLSMLCASLVASQEVKQAESPSRRVTFKSDGDVDIAATYYPVAAASRPAVVLFPGMRFDRKVWDTFALRLQAAGYPALAVDLRGQGESDHMGGKEVKVMDALEEDPTFAPAMVKDARRAARWLVESKSSDHGIVYAGSSLGANIALLAAAEDEKARGVLLMSPGLDYAGLQTLPAVAQLAKRPLLIACGQEAVRADAEKLKAAAQNAELLARQPADHGTALLTSDRELGGLLLAWLEKTFKG